MVGQTIVVFVLLGAFAVLAVLEVAIPEARQSDGSTSDSRLVANFGLGAVTLFVSSLLPIARVSTTQIAGVTDFSFASHANLPWIALVVVLFIGDSFAAYWTHRLMHAAPILWRIHRVHHADSRVDVSTGLRNHPLELIVTLPTSVAVVLLIGAPASAVVVVQTLAFVAALWQHADIHVPPRLCGVLNWAIVTPSLHRLHHSQSRAEHDANYGELLTVWDHLFGTFVPSRAGVWIGLAGQRARADQFLDQIWSPLSYGRE